MEGFNSALSLSTESSLGNYMITYSTIKCRHHILKQKFLDLYNKVFHGRAIPNRFVIRNHHSYSEKPGKDHTDL